MQNLGRIVALEREQIGLLKALGYRGHAIAWHYVKFVVVITIIGIVIGSAAGTWLGTYITQLYHDIAHFPFVVFVQSPDLHVAAALLALLAAILGALRALREIVMLPPAVAMQPPAPPRFHRLLPVTFAIHNLLSQPVVMMMRNITGHPIRALFTTLGMALATAVLIASLFLSGTMEDLINVTYFMADRQDATISFVEKRPLIAVQEIARLPGCLPLSLIGKYRSVSGSRAANDG
jgi:putative ABC transport system permease protein